MAELRLVERREPAPRARGGLASRLRRRAGALSFLLALVVAGCALAVGSGVGSSAPPTLAQRAGALDAQIRCPSCEDISVAQSTASSALAVRHEVATLLAEGESDRAIEHRLVAQYGPSILLEPPKSGLSLLVWVVPLVAVVVALAVLVWFFWHRSRAWRSLQRARAVAEGPPA